MGIYQHILLAIDFSAATEPLVERAQALCKFCAADLSLIHVIEPMFIDASYDVFPAVPLGLEQDAAARAGHELVELGRRIGVAEDHCYVTIGVVKNEILDYAQKHKIDLIVVGSNGRRGVAMLLGSTANAVLHRAKCDVLAVRID
ncbi:MAG: universal stress protein [Thiohalomonadaceae bacterium]|jgi:universal stress protein A